MLSFSRIAAKSKLLISEPVLQDYYFERSVVLLADHNEEGSYGVIINKPIDLHLNEVISDFNDFDTKMMLGGPVRPDNLYYLHTYGDLVEDSIEVIDGVYWGGDFEKIKELIADKRIDPKGIIFYLGYSSWEPEQLNRELNENTWVVVDASKELVFNNEPKKIWSDILKRLGDDYAIWANHPIDPILN